MRQNKKLLVLFGISSLLLGSYFVLIGIKLENKTTVQPSNQPISNPAFPQNIKPSDLTEATPSAAGSDFALEGDQVLVTKVIDGDTIEIESRARIRYLGVDTPETKDPRKPVECFGKEAKNENKKLVEGKVVILQKDVSETDKYGRLLRYVFLPVGEGEFLFVNDYLIRAGFAKVLTIPPDVSYAEQFLEAQREAREEKRGLWGRC